MQKQVDSKKKILNVQEIVQHTLDYQQFSNPYAKNTAVSYLAILTEMSQPNTDVKQFGNTIFITHIKEDNAFFKAFNADTPENFVDNSIDYGDYAAEELGLRTLVTTYKGEIFRNIVRLTSKKRRNQNSSYQIRKSKNGDDVVIIRLKD